MSEHLQQILGDLRLGLTVHYGTRLQKLVLFGSQARGDAEPDSDIDVLVVLTGEVRPLREISATGKTVADVSLKYGVVVTCVFVGSQDWAVGDEPLLKNVKTEGVTF